MYTNFLSKLSLVLILSYQIFADAPITDFSAVDSNFFTVDPTIFSQTNSVTHAVETPKVEPEKKTSPTTLDAKPQTNSTYESLDGYSDPELMSLLSALSSSPSESLFDLQAASSPSQNVNSEAPTTPSADGASETSTESQATGTGGTNNMGEILGGSFGALGGLGGIGSAALLYKMSTTPSTPHQSSEDIHRSSADSNADEAQDSGHSRRSGNSDGGILGGFFRPRRSEGLVDYQPVRIRR